MNTTLIEEVQARPEPRKPAEARRFKLFGALERQLAANGLEGAEIVPIDSLSAQKRMVEAGFGLALMPASSVVDELRAKTLRELRVPSMRTSVPVMLVQRRHAYASAATKALAASL